MCLTHKNLRAESDVSEDMTRRTIRGLLRAIYARAVQLPEAYRYWRLLVNSEQARYHARMVAGHPNLKESAPLRRLSFRCGYEWEVSDSTSAYIFDEVFVRREYDCAELAGARTLVDVGANIGLFTLFGLMRSPNAKVFCVEANPTTFSILSRNLQRNQLSNVTARLFAAASVEGSVAIYEAPESSGGASLFPGEHLREAAVRVQARSLAAFLIENECLSIDVMKIDIEGAEYDVLLSDGVLSGNFQIKALIVEVDASPRDERFQLPELVMRLNRRFASVRQVKGGRYPLFLCRNR